MIALLSLLVGSCAVVDEADRVTPTEVEAIIQTYQRLAEDYEGEPLTMGRCNAACRICVHLRLFGAATRIRVSGEREGALGTADLSRPLKDDLAALIRPVVWAVHTPAARSTATPTISHDLDILSAPVLILGVTSLVAAGVGAAFGSSSASARSELEDGTGNSSRTLELASRLDGHATAANVLFTTAIAAAAGAITWLVVEGGK
ncbi:MAG: hypothetical protein HY791_34115 [Deltaproteobacteria bacterium]|nr:hypothetical protein [Deltaproteobacteria bacterium]